jgi:hypothetical protein
MDKRIQAAVAEFVKDLSDLVRRAALEAVATALRGAGARAAIAANGARPAPSKRVGGAVGARLAKLARRSKRKARVARSAKARGASASSAKAKATRRTRRGAAAVARAAAAAPSTGRQVKRIKARLHVVPRSDTQASILHAVAKAVPAPEADAKAAAGAEKARAEAKGRRKTRKGAGKQPEKEAAPTVKNWVVVRRPSRAN